MPSIDLLLWLFPLLATLAFSLPTPRPYAGYLGAALWTTAYLAALLHLPNMDLSRTQVGGYAAAWVLATVALLHWSLRHLLPASRPGAGRPPSAPRGRSR